MKEILSATPFSGRFLVLNFKDSHEPRVFDTLLIREGTLEKLNDRTFFDLVFVNSDTQSVAWKGALDLDPDVLFAYSVPFSDLFTTHFDVAEKKEAAIVVHDMYQVATGNAPNELLINRMLANLPKRIVSLGELWGWYDTEVREKIYLWIKEQESKE